jgi:PhoH-like ATPase
MTDSRESSKKLFNLSENGVVVADTSSLLMEGVSILKVLPECTLIIPSIVIQELEKKRGHSTLGFLAREWLHLVESIRSEEGIKLRDGVALEDYPEITLRVEPNHSSQKSLPSHLQDGSADSTILAVAQNIKNEDVYSEVVILSNDLPLRLHATLDLKIPAYEFNSAEVTGASSFDGRYPITVSNEEYSESLISSSSGEYLTFVEDQMFEKLPKNRASHSIVELKLENGELIDTFLFENSGISSYCRKQRVSEIVARTLEQDIALHYLLEPADELPIVSLGGSAGTGKTLITMAAAISEMRSKHYQKVIVFRSLHEMGKGQELGFLPGTVEEKMAAWGGAIYDAVEVIATAKKKPKKNEVHAEEKIKTVVADLMEGIEISPITYLRGRSLSNAFIILEEAQNFSRSEILNILSRAGQGSKIVLTFDDAQVDNKFLRTGPKADIWSVVESLKKSDLFAHITLKRTERSRVAELASKLLVS